MDATHEWHAGFVTANQIQIHYHRTGGQKPPLLLLHGITDNGLCWSRVALDLQDQYDIIMTDARGHGSSDGVSSGFTTSALAEDVAGVITSLGLDKPVVYGHSMGAATAAHLAAGHPQLVKAVVLEDPPFVELTPLQADILAGFRQNIADLQALSSEERAATAIAANPGWHELECRAWAQSKAEVNLEIFERVADLHSGSPWTDIVAQIQCPGLLITGDPAMHAIIPPDTAQQAARLWKTLQVVQIAGAGHNIHRDRYAETLQIVRDFLGRWA